MQKSSFKKFAKVTTLVIATSFLGLLIWANWEAKGYTQIHVADSQYVTYDVSGFNINQQNINIEKEISSIEGVSSCSYNSVKKFVGVIFYTSNMSSFELQGKIRAHLGINVTEMEVPKQSGGCPVGGVRYLILHVKHVLNFRS